MAKSKILSVLLLLCLAQLWGCGPSIANIGSKGTTIVCFGDSLTEGVGASEGSDYPSLLADAVDMEVINAGVSGDTTRDALARIEEDVLAYNPRIVIVQFGGNDFLRGLHKDETFNNMDKIVERIQEKGAMVVLVGARFGYLVRGEYVTILWNVGRKRRALVIPNIMEDIFSNPEFKIDEIHPNDAGYRIIANRIYLKIKPLLRK